ncbi:MULTISPECIES: SDR family oxidoreductase [unclassified Imperialibacter]|uniref:SDR family oxidoreductase n=1 Tax=unclassified Imperialibacter TaxID=2629706 RepID=UPI0012528C94|nr:MULTISPECIES: SDR family oxidoreductase [unclassified Imperialibacter]CAD5276566.1 dTDP-4-dehydrorhamnose reductase [Imperialibacter sp. 89]CAD5294698.1 dTDP-4-dehydrorhamnose reductase [Imperialibacter sp. 75]VVT26898.1 dTDP-4-dehydrorhamnose reductase [Imperialibacter sp. EC-SDR9]
MSILITGANGLLGQKLVVLLREKGEDFLATGRGASRIPLEGIRYQSMDITDAEETLKIIGTEKPEVVIHTAAMTNVDQCETDKEGCWLQNVTAVENIVKACEASGAFLLHLSTDFIFDGEDGPYDEEAKANPVSYYGDSKLAAEKAVMAGKIDWAMARTVLVYGIAFDMSRSNIILWVKKSLEDGKTINVVNDQWRTPTLAEDLAMGCYLIAKKKAKGIFNISGKDFMNPYQMAIATADYFGLDKSLINETDGSKFSQPAKRPPKTGFVLDKAKEVLGYDPHSFEEGIAVLAEQLKK